MATKLYDAAQVTVVLANIPIDSGYDEEDFLAIDQYEDDYILVVGADGSTTRCRTNNLSASVKLKLMQTSAGNSFLGALRTAGLLAANGADIGPMLVRDRLSGVCMYTGSECWIARPPEVVYGKKSTPREWTFHVPELIRVDAGS